VTITTLPIAQEEAAMEKGAECVKWLLITDEPRVVKVSPTLIVY